MKVSVAVDKSKCQGFGACTRVAPDAFALDSEQRAEVRNPQAVDPELLLKAARSCPYRAIAAVDTETKEQLHPPVRKSAAS